MTPSKEAMAAAEALEERGLTIGGPTNNDEGARIIDRYFAQREAESQTEVASLKSELSIITHKCITCGVAASHPNASLADSPPYSTKWDSPQAQAVRTLRAEVDVLRQREAARVAAVEALKKFRRNDLPDCEQPMWDELQAALALNAPFAEGT